MLHYSNEPQPLKKAPPDRVNDVLQLYHSGDFQKTLDKALGIIKDYPQTSSIHNILGVVYSSLGQPNQSLFHFREVLKLDPQNANACNNIGTALTELGKYEEAHQLLESALKIKPNYAEALNNLGNLYSSCGQYERANTHYLKAIKLKPNYAEAYNNLGTSMIELKHYDKAISALEKALEIHPHSVEIHNNLGATFNKIKDQSKALQHFDKAIQIKPNYAEAYYNKANCLNDQKDFQNARKLSEKAIRLAPNFANAYNTLGVSLLGLEEYESATYFFKKATSLNPNFADAFDNLGSAFAGIGKEDKALDSIRKAILLNPNSSTAFNNLGNILSKRDQLSEAFSAYSKAVDLDPENAQACSNLALMFHDLGKWDSALKLHEQATATGTDYPDAHFHKSLTLLALERFNPGWELYEWRPNLRKKVISLKPSKPQWAPDKSGTVLLWSEQGVGDKILFGSIISDIYSACSKLKVQTEERLIPLFKRSFPNDIEFYPKDTKIPEDQYEWQISTGSALQHFRSKLDSFKIREKGWLLPDIKKARRIRKKLVGNNKVKLIGISWKTFSDRPDSKKRCIPLNQLAQTLYSNDIKLVNLQYGDICDDVNNLLKEHGIDLLQMEGLDTKSDLDGLAALIWACDLVVTIDNTTVHLAGALGKDCKLLLPFSHDWRWGKNRVISYWHSSVSSIIQRKAGDWKTVLQKLAEIKVNL